MRRIILAAAKGGAGKSTVAVNLAAGLALSGKRVLFLDLDPYAGGTYGLGLQPDEDGLADVLDRRGQLVTLARETGVRGLAAIAAGVGLFGIVKRLESAPLRLREALHGLRGWDVLVTDTPPAVGPLSVAALAAGGEVLVPFTPSVPDLASVAPFLGEAATVRERLARDLRVRAFVPVRVTRTRIAAEALAAARTQYPETTRTEIRQAAAVVEATAAGQPVAVYAPGSPAAEDFRDLARELKEE